MSESKLPLLANGKVYLEGKTMSVHHLEMSVRAFNILLNNEIFNVEDLIIQTRTDLLKLKGSGMASVQSIIDGLAEYGLKLKEEA